jgi:hypothetical protein
MNNGFLLLVGVLSLVCACSSSSTVEDDAVGQAAYTKTCKLTACDSCRDDVSAACSECYDLCRSPYADSSCYSTCSDICHTQCRSCAGSQVCEEWTVTLLPPTLDQALYDKCLATETACTPDAYDRSYCNYIARTMQSTMGKEFECFATKGCDAAECSVEPSLGTLGTSYCERAARCGKPCRDSDAPFLNSVERILRPELVRGVRECIAEETCSVFESCGDAFEQLWQLAWEN